MLALLRQLADRWRRSWSVVGYAQGLGEVSVTGPYTAGSSERIVAKLNATAPVMLGHPMTWRVERRDGT